jgi:hypothetical protein
MMMDIYDMHAAGGGESWGDDEAPMFSFKSKEAFTASVGFDDPDILHCRVLLALEEGKQAFR